MTSSALRPARAPSVPRILAALLEADITVQIRNVRALGLTFFLPLLLLYVTTITKRRAVLLGGPITSVAIALTLGIASMAILGYTNSVVRDREQGVFQRLRVTPAQGWEIITSRLVVQVLANLVMAIVLLVAATIFLKITVSPAAGILTCLCVIPGSSVFLSVGQALAGLAKSADTVNAVGRLAYLPLFVLGLFAHISVFGTTFETVSRWSPGGVVIDMFASALQPTTWSGETWGSLAACLGYAVIFTAIGIRWFRWSTQ
jgi:ABC-2 type transport system permease protein